jgi:hypothetical protein
MDSSKIIFDSRLTVVEAFNSKVSIIKRTNFSDFIVKLTPETHDVLIISQNFPPAIKCILYLNFIVQFSLASFYFSKFSEHRVSSRSRKK